jgi:hypothetical protein
MCCVTPWIVTLLSVGLIGLPHNAQMGCSWAGVSATGHAPADWTKVQYRSSSDGEYRWVVSSVSDVLKGRPGAWCLDCLVRYTRDRATDVIGELDALAARVSEGRCRMCAKVGPVFSSPHPSAPSLPGSPLYPQQAAQTSHTKATPSA